MTTQLALIDPVEPLRLDLGCGGRKKEGFVGVDILKFPGVDIVMNLAMPHWTWADDSVDEVHSSHFLEHLAGSERIYFFNELGRILRVGGKATIITPHWSNACAYGDPTHQWPPVSEWYPLYLNKAWREKEAPHAPYTCDFDFVTGFGFDERVMGWNDERRMFGLAHHINASRDLHVTLTKRAL